MNRNTTLIKLPLAALLAMTFVMATARAATIVSTSSGGAWGATTTWVGGAAPAGADDAQIASGATVTVMTNAAANSVTFLSSRTNIGTLSVNSGIMLNVTGGVTVQNATTNKVSAVISGAGTINCAFVTVGGTTVPTAGGLTTVLTSTIAFLNMTGNLTMAGYDGNPTSQNKPAFNLGSGSVNVGGTVAMTESGAVSGPQGIQTLSLATGLQSGTLTISGSPAFSLSGNVNVTLNGTNSTVVYAGGAQTVLAVPYNNLTLKNPGTKTLSSPVPKGFSISGAVAINNGAIFSVPSDVSATSLYLDGNRQGGNNTTYGGSGSGAGVILSNYFAGAGKFTASATTTATTTAMSRTAGASPSIYGSMLTFHAVVSGATIPNGDTVTFKSGSTVIGTATTTGNAADLTLYNLAVGVSQTITATYAGDNTFVSSTSAGVSQTVTPKTLYVQGLSAANKIFDGTTAATLAGTATLLSAEAQGSSTTDGHPYVGDAVSLSSSAASAFTGTFLSAGIAIGIPVKVTGNSLSGAQAGNYVLASDDEENGALAATIYLVAGASSIGGITHGAMTTINATGIPGNNYVLQRSTNLTGIWVDISTNPPDITGAISVNDTFSDLGGVPPSMAFYRLKWVP